jgi:predicted dehydrogenase
VPVRWGFLGAGVIASNALAPAVYAASNADLYAVAARDAERARALLPTGRAYSSYDEVLADANVDAVYIALANDAHHRWTIAALEAGKHVLCEKPLGLDVREIDEMTSAADDAGRLVVEALFYRWHPQIQRAEQLVRDGSIGRIRNVDAGFAFSGVAPDNYRLDPQRGGGALYDVGCYPISAVLWAFGRSPTSVTATVARGETGVDLSADASLHFDDGQANVHVSIDEPGRQWLTITGDDGVLEVPEQPYTARFGPPSELRIGNDVYTTSATDPYRVMVEQVSAAVRGEPAYVVPLAESRATAAVIDAAFMSAADAGRVVKPPSPYG